MIVEVCANSVQSAMNAEKAGADRIELCAELGVGGITPSLGLLQKVREAVKLPIHVLIRPRSGDFTYSDTELEVMEADIEHCRQVGCQGIVTGVLREDLILDISRTSALKQLAGDLHFTFHRAFDWVPNPEKTLSDLVEIGVHTILSSGGKATAIQGIELLVSLQKQTSVCTIMPGGGIRDTNARRFKEAGFRALHLSAAMLQGNLPAAPPLSMNSFSYLSEDRVAISREEVIRAVVESVK